MLFRDTQVKTLFCCCNITVYFKKVQYLYPYGHIILLQSGIISIRKLFKIYKSDRYHSLYYKINLYLMLKVNPFFTFSIFA